MIPPFDGAGLGFRLHCPAMTTVLCKTSLSGGTSCRFRKLLLSLGWRFIGSVHGREIIPFGLRRVLITPSKLVCSSSIGTFNQYSSPGVSLFIQKVERLQALQTAISQRAYHPYLVLTKEMVEKGNKHIGDLLCSGPYVMCFV